MREHDLEKAGILSYDKTCRWDFEIVESSRFLPPYDIGTRETIANLYAEYASGMLYDAPTVCLESISSAERYGEKISLSVGSFYDFVACNIVGREASSGRFVRTAKATGATETTCAMIDELGKSFESYRESLSSFADLFSATRLPNSIAVSVLVYDENGTCLLSKRTNNVIIAKNFGGVTATGTLEPTDLATYSAAGFDDPFCACAARELQEETSLLYPAAAFELEGMAVGRSKLQPIALVSVASPHKLDSIFELDDTDGALDQKELKRIVPISRDRLRKMMRTHDMTEAAIYHISRHLQ